MIGPSLPPVNLGLQTGLLRRQTVRTSGQLQATLSHGKEIILKFTSLRKYETCMMFDSFHMHDIISYIRTWCAYFKRRWKKKLIDELWKESNLEIVK